MSKMTKTEAALESARTAKQQLAKKLEQEKGEVIRKGSLAGSAFALGALHANGRIHDLPSMGPIPKTGWFVLVPGGIAMALKPGGWKSFFNGSCDAAIGATFFQLGTGERMAGMSGGRSSEADEIARMERALERRRGGSGRRRDPVDEILDGDGDD